MSLGTNPVQELAVNKIPFSNALVTDVEFENGKQTQIITIFNNSEFHYEGYKFEELPNQNKVNSNNF
ncbi:hypothetical protein [Flavobacterium davisii]|uniref:Uncharacterized protein n=1 Tax=Flavobacterium columnare TaxID=996 RepID=A0A8G0P921_9FLAO|nr:hypothetical protein [Flavobacterium davisii]QYS88023.1 hypothetical protein JJC05_09085 [Flavobacterium davisii]